MVAEVQPQGIVSVANHNSELQIVITGSPKSVEQVSALAGQKGAKAISLKVSGAWHSELIKGAEEEFNTLLSEINFHRPQKTLVLNVTGEMATNTDEIKAGMQRQLCSPVKWYDAINTLIQQKMDTFVEVGPGRVLTGLLKKIIPPDYPAKIYNVSNMKQLERFLKETA
jgi:[acyl-carrier-protein] S-malonyltransferase